MISIIIPTLDEERWLPPLLDAIHQQSAAHEVVVVDGGSQDRTLEVARDRGVRTLVSHPGRGAGISIGAEASRGEVLFFLHADSTLPPGALDRINEVLSTDANIIGGNFRLVFDGDTDFSRWLTGFCAWIRLLGLYYGDSGIFVRRSVYEALGGFRPIQLRRIGTLCAASSGLDGLAASRIRPLSHHHGVSKGDILWRSSTGGSGCMRCFGSVYHPTGSLKSIGRRCRHRKSRGHGFSSGTVAAVA